MWRRRHHLVQSTAQRWLLRRHHHLTSFNEYQILSSTRCLGGAASYATNKFLHMPSILSNISSNPSLTRYGDVRANNAFNPFLISCHAFSTRGGKRPRVPKMKDLHSVEEVILTAYEHRDVMSRRDFSAVWARIPQLVSRRQPRHQPNPSSHEELLSKDDTRRMLYKIFDDTTNAIEDCDMRELTGTILGMAKIVTILRRQGKRKGEDSSRVILRELLLNKDIKPKVELFQSFANASMNKLDQFDARHLSNLAYAFALIDFDDGSDLFDHIANEAVAKTNEFKPQELSNMVWAYATMNRPHAVLFESIGDRIVASKHLKEFRPQTLKDTVWAYAKAGVSHPKLFEKVANHVMSYDSLDEFKPQELSNTVWAYAKAGVHHPKLFEKVGNHIVESNSLSRYEPQACSNIVWAYATSDVPHPALFRKMANHIVALDRLVRFEPQALSNTLWAYATAGVSHPKLFQKMAHAALGKLDRFTHPQDFSNTVWACAKAGFRHPKLFDKMANQFVGLDSFHQFEPQALSNTTWAFATAQVSHLDLFENVSTAAIQRKGEFNNPQHIANLMWAYATMGIVDKQLFSSFVPTAAKLMESYNNQALANIAWAYAVANVDAPTLFNDIFINECVEKKDGFENAALFQLHQWHLWQTKENSNTGLPIELLDSSYNVFTSEHPTVSKLQEDVVAQLSSIGLDPQEEVLMDSGYSIDALVEVNGKKVGVEVDGPYHFIGKGTSPLGSTVLKRRQVPSIDGIELVSVPYWEWNELLGKDEVKRQDYLRELLGLVEDNRNDT
mmetsp:Transcript_1826/g.3979  ORF Transcript_1826/g.3979 Transcript_1826/m.3979 type:complete len:785 (+) Transcript_1826:138-2492(+)